jgi:hypothetical protein
MQQDYVCVSTYGKSARQVCSAPYRRLSQGILVMVNPPLGCPDVLWRRDLGTVCRAVGILIAEMAVWAIDGSVSRPREMLRVSFGAGAVNNIIYSRLYVLFTIYRG